MATSICGNLIIAVLLFLVLESDAGASQCTCGPCSCADVVSELPRPVVTLNSGMEVVCDTVTDDGGWVVIQRRASQEVDFYLTWKNYKFGFGNLHGNFWLGLEKIHQLTSQKQYELRFDLIVNSTQFYATYDSFMLFSEVENYELLVGGYSGTAGDSFSSHNGFPFSTKDRDNDINPSNCAQEFHGAWWYSQCEVSNLNGKWNSTKYGEGLDWATATGDHYHSATFTEMKIRPVNLN